MIVPLLNTQSTHLYRNKVEQVFNVERVEHSVLKIHVFYCTPINFPLKKGCSISKAMIASDCVSMKHNLYADFAFVHQSKRNGRGFHSIYVRIDQRINARTRIHRIVEMSFAWKTRVWYLKPTLHIGKKLINDTDPMFTEVLASFSALETVTFELFDKIFEDANRAIQAAEEHAIELETLREDMANQIVKYENQIRELTDINNMAGSNYDEALQTLINQSESDKQAFYEFMRNIEGEAFAISEYQTETLQVAIQTYSEKLKNDNDATIIAHNEQIQALQDRALETTLTMIRMSIDATKLKNVGDVLKRYMDIFIKFESIQNVAYSASETLLNFYKRLLSIEKKKRLVHFLRRSLLRTKNIALNSESGLNAIVCSFFIDPTILIKFEKEQTESFISFKPIIKVQDFFDRLNTLREKSTIELQKNGSLYDIEDRQNNQIIALVDAFSDETMTDAGTSITITINWKWTDSNRKRNADETSTSLDGPSPPQQTSKKAKKKTGTP
jgi:hypothetical protein